MLLETFAMLFLLVQGSANPASSQSGSVAVAENPDQIICRAAEPKLGSRVARRRMCRTRAQWRAYEADRQQLQRDLNNNAGCGGHASCTSDE